MQSTIGTATATTEVLMLTIFMIFPVQEFTAFAQQSGLFAVTFTGNTNLQYLLEDTVQRGVMKIFYHNYPVRVFKRISE